MTNPLSSLWSLLTEPSPRVIDQGERGHARTLAIFILLSLALYPLPVLLKYQDFGVFQEARPLILMLPVPSVLAYVLSRTRFFAAGAVIQALLFWAGIVTTSSVDPTNKVSLCFLLIPVMICAATIDQKSTVFMSVFCLLTDLGLYLLAPAPDRSDMVGTQLFLFFGIGLILYLRRNQDLLAADRKRALEASVANHQELLSTTFDGTAIHAKGRIVEADESFAQLFGLTEAEIIYNPLVSLFPDHQHARLEPLVYEGSGRPEELLIHHAQGLSRWVELVCQRQVDPMGDITEILAARDVTERKTLQQQVLFTGRMVAMGTLAAGVAHEINNPLTYIMGHQQLLGRELKPLLKDQDPRQTKQIQHRLHVIREGVDRVRQIVSDLKTFSRGDDEATSIVDLHQVAETAIQMTWNEIRHRAQLIRDFQEAPRVEASPAHLGQVLINLLMNAVQALPEDATNEMRITISVGTKEDGSAWVSVGDTGKGIPQAQLERIFEPFFTTKPVGQGTGLGLSICHNIIRRYRGEITVKSSDEGTVFDITLPPSSKSQVSEPSPEQSRTPSPTAGGRVMVVDDEPEIARLLAEMLTGFDVTVAKNGKDALDCWHTEDFDAVVCDLMMPEVSGMDIYTQVQESDPGKECRLLFITGGAFTPATREFLESLEQPWLQKPFNPKDLRAMVEELCKASRAENEDG